MVTIMKKEILPIVLKLLIVFWLFLLGILALTSCSSSHHLQVDGSGIVITNDTTYVRHGGFLNSKNYVPYER